MLRVELREVATEEDALEVVELMRQTLLDEFLDGSGMLDFRRSGGKSKQVWVVTRFCYAISHLWEWPVYVGGVSVGPPLKAIIHYHLPVLIGMRLHHISDCPE